MLPQPLIQQPYWNQHPRTDQLQLVWQSYSEYDDTPPPNPSPGLYSPSLSIGKEGSTATSYWLDNLSKKRDYSVYASRNKLKALRSAGIVPEVSSSYNQSTYGEFLSEVAYQYSAGRPCNTRRKVSRHFYTNGATSVTLRKHKVWKYFPHFSTDDAADGILWDILELQGKYKMWYIGSSVSFESLKSVIEYNKLLLSLAKLPTS